MIIIVIITIINVLLPVKLNRFTHLRALLVLHDRGIFPPTEVAQITAL
jgi:hypothetical protein